MKLIIKFNLVFIGIFVIGLLVAAKISYTLLQNNARDEIVQNARIMLQAALASRSYTNAQVKPLLETQMKYQFLPQSLPAYAAAEIFKDLRTKFPDYTYKEATLNPTNPRNRATDWETDVVNQFRGDESMAELIGERDTPSGRSLYLARPIRIKDGACLVCHSTVEAAPKTMLELYGTAHGFGWKLNEAVGAQVVSVPTEVALQRAGKTFTVFMWSLAGVFAFISVALNLMLTLMVIRPVTRLAKIADEVSLGDLDAPEFEHSGRDEIGALANAFERMRTSLVKALKMLET